MKKKIIYTSFLITAFLMICTLSGWGNEKKSLPYPDFSSRLVPITVYCTADTVPPKKVDQDKEKKDGAIKQEHAEVTENNVVVTVKPEELKTIKEVPRSKKKIKPVKIDGVPPPKNIIKPKIIVKKIKI
ncbi:MAG: hypothetical protein QM768_19345 [Agriterribacter sp.]